MIFLFGCAPAVEESSPVGTYILDREQTEISIGRSIQSNFEARLNIYKDGRYEVWLYRGSKLEHYVSGGWERLGDRLIFADKETINHLPVHFDKNRLTVGMEEMNLIMKKTDKL